MEIKKDINYCFLNDVGYDSPFNPETFKILDGIKLVDCKPYRDPDACSKKLYETLKYLYSKKLPNGEELSFGDIRGNFPNNITVVGLDLINIKKVSSDFIGPSISSAKKRKIDDIKIGQYLLEARTIGGHIIWPVPINKSKGQTINTARGGDKGFNDRFDLTLIDLKKYYDGDRNCKLINEYDDSEEWLSKYINFRGFIDFFYLQDFVDENYNVILMAPLDEPIPMDFKMYINKNLELIMKRNLRIQQGIMKDSLVENK